MSNKFEQLFWKETDKYISRFIDDGMVIAWLSNEAQLYEIWYVARKQGLPGSVKFYEFQEVFLRIAEDY